MATGQNIFDRAVERSSFNDPDLLPPAQVLQFITADERAVYARVAQIEPEFLGKDAITGVRADDTESWDLATTPGDVFSLTRAEVSVITGTVTGVALLDKVNLISIRRPTIEVAPRAYMRGRKIYQYESELGSSVANYVTTLNLFYSPVPTTVTALTQTVMLPDEWSELLVLPLARRMALRDRRLDEVPIIDAELKYQSALFESAAIAFGHGVRRSPISIPSVKQVQTGG